MTDMDLIQQAADILPLESADHIWLTWVLQNPETAPHSVQVMARQTACTILGIGTSGPFALPSPKNYSPPPTAAELAEPEPEPEVDDNADEPVIVLAAGQDGTFTAESLEVLEHAEDDPAEVVPVSLADPGSLNETDDENEQEGEPGVLNLSTDGSDAPSEDEDQRGIFGTVPSEVDDAVFANELNGKPRLDIVIINDEPEAVAVEDYSGASAPLTDAYVPTPLPLYPPLPPMQSEDFIGSEPVASA